MNFKASLLSQSLLCIGMVMGDGKEVWAEAIAPVPPAEPLPSQECCHLQETESTLLQAIRISYPDQSASTTFHPGVEFSRSLNGLASAPITPASKGWLEAFAPAEPDEPMLTLETAFEAFSEASPQEAELAQEAPLPPETSDPSSPLGDPELGQLRIQTPPDPELGQLRLWEQPLGDPELGRLRLQEEPALEDVEEDVVFLLGEVSIFSSDNILLDDFDPVDDQVFSGGITLFAAPSVGPNTYLFGSIGGNLAFYNDLSELNYSDIELMGGVRQVLGPSTYADFTVTHQQFFSLSDGDRFLTDNSLRLSLSHREQLTSRLFLDGYYQLRLSFTDPSDRNRIFNQLGASLGYQLTQDLDTSLNYQLVLTDFTQQDRYDTYHEVTAQLNYYLSRNSQVSLFAGFSFGDSSESFIDFDSSLLGIVFSTNLSLF